MENGWIAHSYFFFFFFYFIFCKKNKKSYDSQYDSIHALEWYEIWFWISKNTWRLFGTNLVMFNLFLFIPFPLYYKTSMNYFLYIILPAYTNIQVYWYNSHVGNIDCQCESCTGIWQWHVWMFQFHGIFLFSRPCNLSFHFTWEHHRWFFSVVFLKPGMMRVN